MPADSAQVQRARSVLNPQQRYSLVTKERLKALLAEYGRIALATYLVLFALVLAGFAAAFALGFEGQGIGDGASAFRGASLLGAAYLATKLVQPLRILATVAVTPLVASAIKRLRPVKRPAD